MHIIMHIDMDYFFAACEELKRPELRNKPTIVGADPKGGKGRGVVMTCNYIARKYGIHSGMPISTAYKLKPDANYLPMDYSYYEQKSHEVISIIREHAKIVEQMSIDEAFIDISDIVDNYNDALAYAQKLKGAVTNHARLPCSIGISTNKLMAKMACESAKPNGIKLITENEAQVFLEDMPVEKLYGVGKKTREKLDKMGYDTIGELAHANIMDLMNEFGTFGIELHDYANGQDDSEVKEVYDVRSIGREKTFEYDTKDNSKVLSAIEQLSRETIKEVNEHQFYFKTVTIKIRYSNFQEHMKSRKIRPSSDVNDIIETARQLYLKNIDKNRKVRKIGVRVSGLSKYKNQKRLADYFKI